jgi:hypothetical protein
MAAGEFPVTLLTPNFQVTVTSTLVVGINNSVLPVPSTPSQTERGFVQSTVTLGPTGLTSCPNIGSYTQLSVLQWSTNPYVNSKSVRSELVRFSATSQKAVTRSSSRAHRPIHSPSNTPAPKISILLLERITTRQGKAKPITLSLYVPSMTVNVMCPAMDATYRHTQTIT